jgi:short-subunit dehydrogenase
MTDNGDPQNKEQITVGETGPVALVTGASSGIGEAAARELVAAGFTVYGTSRKAVAGDQRDDVLVNNAGFGVAGAAEESSVEQARALFETNVFGLMRVTRAVLPVMRAQGSGRIINVSSIVGLIPVPFMALYASSKHALEGYSESLDHEVREHGIRVLLVEPGFTKTAFDANLATADEPLSLYARRRELLDEQLAIAVKAGDEPSLVGRAVVAAATDRRPKLRYPTGALARRVSKARRYVPAPIFDRQIRKLNQLPA